MRKRIKIIGAIGLALLMLAAAGTYGAWWWMGRPLYQPGDLATGEGLASPLEPPSDGHLPGRFDVATGISLHTFERGEGPVVLVVHGGPGMPPYESFDGLDRLSDRYRFVYYHQRGCGESTRPIDRFEGRNVGAHIQQLDAALGLAEQVADIERIRRLLGEEQLIVLGHSYGGFLAALYAAEFPQRVRALVLVSPAELVEFPPPSGGLYAQVEAQLPAEMADDYAAYQERLFDFNALWAQSDEELVALQEEFTPYYLAAMESKGQTPPDAEQASRGAGGWMVWAQFMAMGRSHDYRPALAEVTAPALVIHGADDMQPEYASRRYTDYLSETQFEVIEGAGHFAFVEQPDLFARVVGDYLP